MLVHIDAFTQENKIFLHTFNTLMFKQQKCINMKNII